MALNPTATPRQVNERLSRRTGIFLNTASVAAQVTDRGWETEAQTASTVVIQVPNWGSRIATETTADDTAKRNIAWRAPTQVTTAPVVLEMNRVAQDARAVEWLDYTEAPFDILAGAQQQVASNMRASMDKHIIDRIVGLTYAAETDDATRQDATPGTFGVGAGNSNALTLVEGAGFAKGTGGRLVEQGMSQAELRFQLKDVMSQDVIGGSAGQGYCFMRPELNYVLRNDLISRDFHWDELTSAMLGAASFVNGVWRRMLHGWRVIVSNRLPRPTAGQDWSMYFMTDRAVAFAMRPPITKRESPTDPGVDNIAYSVSQASVYGSVLVNAPLLERCVLNTVDS